MPVQDSTYIPCAVICIESSRGLWPHEVPKQLRLEILIKLHSSQYTLYGVNGVHGNVDTCVHDTLLFLHDNSTTIRHMNFKLCSQHLIDEGQYPLNLQSPWISSTLQSRRSSHKRCNTSRAPALTECIWSMMQGLSISVLILDFALRE